MSCSIVQLSVSGSILVRLCAGEAAEDTDKDNEAGVELKKKNERRRSNKRQRKAPQAPDEKPLSASETLFLYNSESLFATRRCNSSTFPHLSSLTPEGKALALVVGLDLRYVFWPSSSFMLSSGCNERQKRGLVVYSRRR